MASETKQITIRELWLQMRGIENAFRYYSDALNGVASVAPKGYDTPVPVPDKTYTVISAPFEHDCTNPPWCKISFERFAANFGKLQERIGAISVALESMHGFVPDGTLLDFYMSEVPGTSWSGQPAPGRN
jgi:hypothetical protein